ncbi:GntR family transcriptional regulator [Gilvimarinus algae]|uniref:GntR family transcriptional regulator n=1 Tax=Gilvimarinus algae TaxID=3058037 RepID=A0ABT8TAV1_9GAMM|nr:GntR family transcriptional regulator [Gilvimarinus sp. SDUM040014]MDO3381241.1 GntR family transcriptional regulator [Gilvimarinus sp. SDUM040014]
MAKPPVRFFDKAAADGGKGISYHRPSASQIYGFVRDAIVSMELLPGQMISETALAAKFGVSRTPVREALIQLSAIGFVDVLPQRGTFVSRFSMEKILEARFIREALELSVVSYLAENITDEIVEAGERIIAEQKLAAADDDALAFQKLDDCFHQTLADFTCYPRVALLIEAEKAHMDRVRNLSLHMRGQYKRVLSQHSAIIKALKSGSPAKAVEAMSVHMKDVYNVLKVIPKEHPEYFL